ncbi:MAG: 2-amino-4-hydroxy-6-hydroxymethyldihydropteridine diphosphokinase [Bacteroidota bacterium]
MDDVFLGIGSNMGDRIYFLAQAVRKMRELPSTHIVKVSSMYETEPVGVKNQGDFLNAVVWAQTSVGVADFHSRIKLIEKEIGRLKRIRWGPREIDIDILLYGNIVMNEATLTIPHAELINRKFVLQPLAEIASETVHPAVHKTVRALLAECKDTNSVERSAQLTRSFFTTLQE